MVVVSMELARSTATFSVIVSKPASWKTGPDVRTNFVTNAVVPQWTCDITVEHHPALLLKPLGNANTLRSGSTFGGRLCANAKGTTASNVYVECQGQKCYCCRSKAVSVCNTCRRHQSINQVFRVHLITFYKHMVPYAREWLMAR